MSYPVSPTASHKCAPSKLYTFSTIRGTPAPLVMGSISPSNIEHGFDFGGNRTIRSIVQERGERDAAQHRERTISRTRQSVISTEDIVIPAHLLGTVSDQQEWAPAREQPTRHRSRIRSDPHTDFDVVRIANEQRSRLERHVERANSITVANLGRRARADAFAVPGAGLPRWPRTSLPNNSLNLAISTSASSANPRRPGVIRNSISTLGVLPSIAPTSAVDFAKSNPLAEPLAGSTTLFTRLSKYDLRDQARPPLNSTESGSSDVDPFSDSFVDHDAVRPNDFAEMHAYGRRGRRGTGPKHDRKPSVVQLAAEKVGNVVQAATSGVENMIRRSSLADLYARAQVRSKKLQRKKWVQSAFQWTIYLLLLMFIYFVLVGQPLWQGAVWWLYWVVDHKFVVSGTWSVTIGLALMWVCTPFSESLRS